MEGRYISEPGKSGSVDRLRWHRGVGCLLPLIVFASVLFAIAAFSPALVEDLADGRRGDILRWTAAVTVAGVNVPVALAALWLGWETFRFGWRWADEFAVVATPLGLVPHRSTWARPIAWEEIVDVRYMRIHRAHALMIVLRNGRVRTIRGVDGEGAGDFAARARSRLSTASQASG